MGVVIETCINTPGVELELNSLIYNIYYTWYLGPVKGTCIYCVTQYGGTHGVQHGHA
jgi:hypothetical protein